MAKIYKIFGTAWLSSVRVVKRRVQSF